MLIVRDDQMKELEAGMMRAFEAEMFAHCKDFSPRLCKVIGDDQLRVALREAIQRAAGYQFTNRGPIRLFIEMMFLRGSAFDTDPQYPKVGAALRAPADQMDRAEQIHLESLDYYEKVSGPNAVNAHKALRKLKTFTENPVTFSSHTFVPDIIREIVRIYPQKAAYVGKEGLTTLIQKGCDLARKFDFSTPRSEALVVVLMFAFGHGCTEDPLYPWISRILGDERIINPPARAERLEKKAVTWLDAVLAGSSAGA